MGFVHSAGKQPVPHTKGHTMMSKLEKAQIVHDKTGASFEESREALEACDYDVLDAIVWLERRGKAQAQTTSYTTTVTEEDITATEMSQAQSDYERATKDSGFTKALNSILDFIKRALRKSIDVSFVAERKGEQVLSMPVLLLVLLLIFAFWIVLPLLIVGLFFNFRYHFDGIGSVTVNINDVMDKASNGAESLKRDVTGSSDTTSK